MARVLLGTHYLQQYRLVPQRRWEWLSMHEVHVLRLHRVARSFECYADFAEKAAQVGTAKRQHTRL